MSSGLFGTGYQYVIYEFLNQFVHPWGGLLTLTLPNALFAWLFRHEGRPAQLARPFFTSMVLSAVIYRVGLEHMTFEIGSLLAWSASVAAIVWFGWRHVDLRVHVVPVAIAVGLGVILYRVGFRIGRESAWTLGGATLGFGMVLLVICAFHSILNRTLNDLLGGMLVDLVFSEGAHGEKFAKKKKLPSVSLLRHWRDHGWERKACRVARRHLAAETENYPLWLFVAETAALNRDVRAAERLVRRLCRSEAFHKDQKHFAFVKLKDWAASANYPLRPFEVEPRIVEPPYSLKAACELREQGRFQEAERKLRRLLVQEPENLSASLLLMRIYAQDMQCRAKADVVLRKLGRRDFVPEAFIEFAGRLLDEWAPAHPVAAE